MQEQEGRCYRPIRRSSRVAVCLAILIQSFIAGSVMAQTRPAAPARRGAPRRPVEQTDAERHQADAQLNRILDDPTRPQWTELPPWIKSVWIDARNRAWFKGQTIVGADSQLRASVEEAFAGKTRVLRDCTPLLIDHTGRFWLLDPNLACYDGTQWKQFDIQPAGTRLTHSVRWNEGNQRAANPRPFANAVIREACEDSSGNIWVLEGIENTGWAIHQILPDGTVRAYPIVPELEDDYYFISQHYTFYPNTDGTVLLVAPLGARHTDDRSQPTPSMMMLRWNGHDAWQKLTPHFCDHPIEYVVPQENGSIKYICSGGRCWTYWPDDKLDVAKALAASWLPKLNDIDSEVREQATREMLTLGPQLEQVLPKINEAELNPEVQVRLERIRANIRELDNENAAGMHANLVRYDAHVELGAVTPVARTAHGGVVLAARPAKEDSKDNPYPQALVWLSADGRCTVKPMPGSVDLPYLTSAGALVYGFADASETVWQWRQLERLDGFLYLTSIRYSKNSQEFAVPPGTELGEIVGQDANQRIYVNNLTHVAVFDQRLPAFPDQRQPETFTGNGLASVIGAHEGWSFTPKLNRTSEVRFLVDGDATQIPIPAAATGSYHVIPLTRDAALFESDDGLAKPFFFFDGSDFKSHVRLENLISANFPVIFRNAPSMFVTAHSGSSIAVDTRGNGIWLSKRDDLAKTIPVSASAQLKPALIYFNGSSFQDVLPKLVQMDPRFVGDIVCTADHGHAVLMQSRKEGLPIWIDHDDRGELRAKVAAKRIGLLVGAQSCVADPGGGVWLGSGSGYSPPQLMLEDQLQPAPFNGLPLLCDSKDRVWFSEESKKLLHVKVGTAWSECAIPSLDSNLRLLESPKGKLILLGRTAISLIEISSDQPPKIREAATWPWDAPKESFTGAFIDSKDGVWINGDARRVARYPLPELKPIP